MAVTDHHPKDHTKPLFYRKSEVCGEFVHLDKIDWQPMPAPFCHNGIRWKLLHVSPELGSWTAIFDCPAGSSFSSHIHIGPGEYFLTKGQMDVRGGDKEGGDTAYARGYGYEPSMALHEKTYFPLDSEFYMTFVGPLHFVDESGNTVAVAGWRELQALWLEQTVKPQA